MHGNFFILKVFSSVKNFFDFSILHFELGISLGNIVNRFFFASPLDKIIEAEENDPSNLFPIFQAIEDCFIKDKNLTLQQIETYLRKNKCRTYLMAKPRTFEKENLKFIGFSQHREEEKKYRLWISTRFFDEVKSEMFDFSPPSKAGDFEECYKINFERLAETGDCINTDDEASLLDNYEGGVQYFDFATALEDLRKYFKNLDERKPTHD